MNYVDFAIAASLFLFFFAAVIMFVTNYFSSYSSLTKTSELKPVTESLFSVLFKSKGVPENWDANHSLFPVKVGLVEDLYMIPMIIKENIGSARTNEPVTIRTEFDENCQNKSWNTTLRLYDENENEINLEISDTTFCGSTRFLNVSNVTWNVNISANQMKRYYLFYSSEENVTDPSYRMTYNTDSWIPSSGDAWTETTTNWTRYEGSSGEVTADTINEKKGNSCINITGNFSGSALGLRYNQTDNITGVSNGWYIDAWVYIENKANLKTINIRVNDNNESIFVNISGSISNGEWYHFVKELSSTAGWANWSSFNASKGIDYVDFYVENNTPDLTRILKIDGLYFKKKPLTVKTFPEEKTDAISYNKFEVMKNLSYDELKKTIGDYKMSLQIDNETYGGYVNQSANAVCYQSSTLIQYKNGTVKKIVPNLCVWK